MIDGQGNDWAEKLDEHIATAVFTDMRTRMAVALGGWPTVAVFTTDDPLRREIQVSYPSGEKMTTVRRFAVALYEISLVEEVPAPMLSGEMTQIPTTDQN